MRVKETDAPPIPTFRKKAVGTALPTADEAGTLGGYVGNTREDVLAQAFENPAPDLMDLFRRLVAPGVAAVNRGLSPDGDPDLPGPLRIAGQAAGKALELTPFPAIGRLDAAKRGEYTYETPD